MADCISAAVKANHVAHVVMLSSVGADLSSGTGPIQGLHYFENALRGSGTSLTAIRACYFQENVGNVHSAAKQAGVFPIFAPSPDASMPMIATRDIGHLAAAELHARRRNSEIIDLHGPTYSMREVAKKLETALGKPLQLVNIPSPEYVNALKQAGFSQHVAEVFAEMYSGFP